MQAQEYSKMFQLEDTHWWFSSKRNFAITLISSLSSKSKKFWILVAARAGIY